MKKESVKISSLAVAVLLLVCPSSSGSRAGISGEATIVRKKISDPKPNHETNRIHSGITSGLKKPTFNPKSEVTMVLEDSADELAITYDSLLNRNLPPTYDSEGRINPFQPLFAEKPTSKDNRLVPVPTGRTNLTPLEKIDLSQLKLTAIVLALSGNRGLVQEASGRGHVIAQGTYIGTRGGVVASVQKGSVIVEEKMQDVYGKILIAKTELKLNKK